MMLKDVLAVFVGGGAGSILRYLIAQRTLQISLESRFPFGTLVVNIVGCFLVGILAVWFTQPQWQSQSLRLLFITGFAGGFTTFSAFGLETFEMLEVGSFGSALLYILLSLILGVGLATLGAILTRSVLG